MRGAAEHRPGAVVHQHEVRDIDRQMPIRIERMRHRKPGVEAHLLRGLDLGRSGPAAFAIGDERSEFGRVGGHRGGQRVFSSDRDEAGTIHRIGAGGEHLDPFGAARKLKGAAQPLALADPVFLHQPDFVGPLVEAAQPFEQFVRKLRDPQEPLAQLALLDQRARTPAAPVDHLFVGEHGLIDRVPVDRRFLAINQPAFVQIEEQGLFVAVIVRLASCQFAAPVEREAKPLQLRLHIGDVGAGPAAGVDALLHRGVFRRHPERIPAHRVQHFVPAHPLVARQHVAHRVVADVADVDPPRGVGKHLEHIAARLSARAIGSESLRVVPRGLPARIGGGGIETFGGHLSHPDPFVLSLSKHRSLLLASRATVRSKSGPSTGSGQPGLGNPVAQPFTAERRRSRALVRMMSSSFWTVAA